VVPGELRIYSTTIPAMDRRCCLMQDRVYRACVRMLSMGYAVSPTLSAPPAATAPNVNLALVETADGRACRVVVTAGSSGPLRGTLELEPDPGIAVAERSHGVDLESGGMCVSEVDVTAGVGSGPRPSRIVGNLRCLDGRLLRTEVWVPSTAKPTATGALAEAEDILAQGGGEVRVRSDKANVRGKCISHWDRRGHYLEWTVEVPATGRYEFLVRYCSPHEAKRVLLLDGAQVREIVLPITGGFGSAPGDWEQVTFVKPDGKPFQLEKGRHTIRLMNSSDTGMNVDYLGFVRK